MNKDFILAESLYDYTKPEVFNVWKGCNEEPEYLSKHLAATDVSILVGLILDKKPNLIEVNAIEEITYVTIGYPKCWENNKELYFISKEEMDIED